MEHPQHARDLELERRIASLEAELRGIRIYYDRVIEDQRNSVKAALASTEIANSKAEVGVAQWRAQANEWRAAMTDRDRLYMPRAEVESSNKGFVERLTTLEKWTQQMQGTGNGVSKSWVWIIGAVATAGTLLSIIERFNPRGG